jgi:hypothetical protein
MAVIASALAASALTAGTAQAATVTVFPNNPTVGICFPFGIADPASGSRWTPHAAFIYQNVPSFELSTGDTLAFDLGNVNDADIQLRIALARTTTNGGDVEDEPFKTVVTNNQTPLNPRGDTTVGNFELKFTAEAPFSFPGGGLIIRFSDPSTSYQADNTCLGNSQNLVKGSSSDTSGFFVKVALRDADGVSPWPDFNTTNIGAFQVVTTDPTPPTPPPDPQPPPGDGEPGDGEPGDGEPGDGEPGDGDADASDFTLGKVKKNKKKGTAKLTVKNLPDPGVLELAKTKKVKGKEKTADASKEKLPIKPKGKAKKKLNRTGKAKVKAEVAYTSDDGGTSTKSKKVKLKKR